MKGGLTTPQAQRRDSSTDDELMSRLARGETQALGALYVRYDRMVKAAICQFAPEMSLADVEEVAQEVFVAVFDMAPRYEEQAKFRGWLYGITARKARDWRRKTWVRRRLLRENPKNTSPAMAWKTEESPLHKAEQREALSLLLSSLPAKHLEVVLLHVVEGLKAEEIAEALKIRPKTVRTRLHRARRNLLASELADQWKKALGKGLS